jgi:hypothetical protein
MPLIIWRLQRHHPSSCGLDSFSGNGVTLSAVGSAKLGIFSPPQNRFNAFDCIFADETRRGASFAH